MSDETSELDPKDIATTPQEHTIVLAFEGAVNSEYMVDIRYQIYNDGVPSKWFTVERFPNDQDGAFNEAQRRAQYWVDSGSNIVAARVIQVKTLFAVKKKSANAE